MADRPTPRDSGSVDTTLDQLPRGPMHRLIVRVLSAVFFFEFADLNTFAYAAPVLRRDRHFTLTDISHVTSAGFLGMFIGAVIAGRTADRLGRQRSLRYSVFWFSLFSLATAAVSDPAGLMAMRFLTGFGLSAMTVVAISYLSETMPAAERGRAQASALAVGLLGIPAAAFLARAIIPLADEAWRGIFVFGGAGLFLLPALARLPESPRWLLRRGRVQQARATALSMGARQEDLDRPTAASASNGPHLSWISLFRGRLLRRTTVLVTAWGFAMAGFYAFASWVPALLAENGFSVTRSLTFSAITTLGAVPGALLARQVTDRYSRKRLMTLTALALALFGVLYGLSTNSASVLIFGLLVAALGQTFTAFIYAYTPEILPTEIRTSGSGVAYGAGRLANVIAPLLIPPLLHGFGYAAVFAAIAGCWIATALVIGFFGPQSVATPRKAPDGDPRPAPTGDPSTL